MKVTKSEKKEVNQLIDVPQEGEADVKPFGKKGAHIIVSNQWIGRKVKLTLLASIIVTSIISLSVFASAFASSSAHDDGVVTNIPRDQKGDPKPIPDAGDTSLAIRDDDDNNNKNNGGGGDDCENRVKCTLDRLFRSSSISSSDDNHHNNNIPVISPIIPTQLNATTTNSTNTTGITNSTSACIIFCV